MVNVSVASFCFRFWLNFGFVVGYGRDEDVLMILDFVQ